MLSKKWFVVLILIAIVGSVLLTACGQVSAGGQIDLIGGDGGSGDGSSVGGLDTNTVVLLAVLAVVLIAALGRRG